jgi:hypothetical protein
VSVTVAYPGVVSTDRFIKLLAPGLVENMAMAALKDEARPRQ